ncbi:MAG TPA: phosphonoacetaldehyde hydrolase [Candidatus Hungatella pullicola]|nr:phosphonoacetaldehyde hydrolase [Candidatus Hungatella pullicola]
MEKKIAMVVFDWAGTTVDYGSSAPMVVFDRVFKEAGIQLSREQINGPMGLEKRAHIKQLLELEDATKQWKETYNRMWTEDDVDQLYETFEEKLAQVVAEYSIPIDGTVETVGRLRDMGIKIGSTTGYTSQMMEGVIPRAESCGYKPDCVVTPDVTGEGRPSPFMLFECMRELHVYPVTAVVKVGDTITDIKEGKNAGAWSVGILQGSNLLGLTKEEYDAMDQAELVKRKETAKEKYLAAGADMVIDSIKDLPEAIREIEKEMN